MPYCDILIRGDIMDPEKNELWEKTEADIAGDSSYMQVGDYIVKIEYSAGKETLEDRLKQYISWLARRESQI